MHGKRLDNWLVVIPARISSSRLHEKPLQDLKGKPLVVRVWDNLLPLREAGADLIVATDSERIRDTCSHHQVSTVLTRPDHQSGTDRCQEVAEHSTRPYILNVQGDEPFVQVADLMTLMRALEVNDMNADMATLAYRSSKQEDWTNPNVVKIAIGARMQALYFSRSGLPFDRSSGGPPPEFWQHIGVYAFSRQALATICSLPPSPLEKAESLEQLRALEHGLTIAVIPASSLTHGIDTPEDLEAARAFF